MTEAVRDLRELCGQRAVKCPIVWLEVAGAHSICALESALLFATNKAENKNWKREPAQPNGNREACQTYVEVKRQKLIHDAFMTVQWTFQIAAHWLMKRWRWTASKGGKLIGICPEIAEIENGGEWCQLVNIFTLHRRYYIPKWLALGDNFCDFWTLMLKSAFPFQKEWKDACSFR